MKELEQMEKTHDIKYTLVQSILLISQDEDVMMEDYGDVPTLTIAPYQVLDNY